MSKKRRGGGFVTPPGDDSWEAAGVRATQRDKAEGESDRLRSAGHWLLVIVCVLAFFLFMALVALGAEKGWLASGDDCAEYYDACTTGPSYDPYEGFFFDTY